MKVFIVYCHPSDDSFTYQVYQKFMEGLRAAGHEIVVSDLYAMDFQTDISLEEYQRETHYRSESPVSEDVRAEQEKIEQSDAIAWIYPVFWTEAPAKLVGWFDRVWTTGYAYNPNPKMKVLEKALVIACAGKTLQSLERDGETEAMRTVMLGDRIKMRAKEKEMIILDGITRWDPSERERRMKIHLDKAYELGTEF